MENTGISRVMSILTFDIFILKEVKLRHPESGHKRVHPGRVLPLHDPAPCTDLIARRLSARPDETATASTTDYDRTSWVQQGANIGRLRVNFTLAAPMSDGWIGLA